VSLLTTTDPSPIPVQSGAKAQATCCAPGDKADCCGPEHEAGSCGCSARAADSDDVREKVRARYAAAATAAAARISERIIGVGAIG